MTVVHVITRMIRGGADENTLFTVNGLAPARYRPVLVVGSGSEEHMLNRVAPHVEVVVIPELVREISPREDAVALERLRRYLRQSRAEIVHTHLAKGGIVGRFAARAARSPIIVHTLHGSTFHEHLDRLRYGLYWSLEKLTARFTDRIISVGEDLQQRYLDAGIGKPSQYQVIRSGMDLHRFQAAAELSTEARAAIKRSLGVPENAPLVGKVARLEARKGYHYFLELAASVLKARPDAHFVGIGAGELQETLRQQAQSQGIGDRVHFVGFRSDIADVLASLDVIVLTSLWEGLPRVLVQAAVCGTPAVTFAVEGAWEVVKEGQNGYIVPSRDTQAMSRRVLELLADPVRAREMGQTGRRLVHEGWTIESMVSAISTVYDELARLKRLPGATR